MRIASLLPSATEILSSLGLTDQLVAVSHGCDYPPEVEQLPRATEAAPDDPEPLHATELAAWRFRPEVLREANPDLVLVGDTSGTGRAQAAARAALGADSDASIVVLNPLSLEGIFNAITTIGAMTESEDEAMGLIEILRQDLGDLEEIAAARRDEGGRPPRVAILESLEPLMVGSRWLPELVRRAGGWDVLGCEGEARATTTTWEEIVDVDPEMLLLAPAGLTLQQTIETWRSLTGSEEMLDTGIRDRQVFAIEPVFLNRPGPRIVDAVGILGEIFDPNVFVDTSPPNSWTPIYG